MLVLSRKAMQQIWIGESVLLTVVSLKNGRVRLAFEAPHGVVIDRAEVRTRRQEFLPGSKKSERVAVEARRN